MRYARISVVAATLLALSLGSAVAQQPAPKPKKVKKGIFTVQCQFGAADSSRVPIGMLYGTDIVDAASRIRTTLLASGLQLAQDGGLLWTTSPVTSWPADGRANPWRAYAYPGVYASLVLGQKADTVVLLGGAEALCASSPGAPDSTVAFAIKLFAEQLTAALQRSSPMPWPQKIDE
jgi:hypothetical protein